MGKITVWLDGIGGDRDLAGWDCGIAMRGYGAWEMEEIARHIGELMACGRCPGMHKPVVTGGAVRLISRHPSFRRATANPSPSEDLPS